MMKPTLSRWLWLGCLLVLLAGMFPAQAFYNPTTGRWLSRDPIEEEGGLNLYEYAANDPISTFDSLGLSSRREEKFKRQSVCTKCCECAVTVSIGNVEFTSPSESPFFMPGHIFDVDVHLEYRRSIRGGTATLKWEEYSNRMPEVTKSKGAKDNQWNDMAKLWPDADGTKNWKTRDTSCPEFGVGRTVHLFDWPSAKKSLGRRTLHFRISIINPKDCGCDADVVTATAVQILDPTGPPVFLTPDPNAPQ